MNDRALQALAGATWRKSSRSQGQSDCVEVAAAAGWVGIRDSKLGAASPMLAVTAEQWPGILATLRVSRPTD
jgi:hypothetical protein